MRVSIKHAHRGPGLLDKARLLRRAKATVQGAVRRKLSKVSHPECLEKMLI